MFSLTRMREITAEVPPQAVAYDSQDWLKALKALVAFFGSRRGSRRARRGLRVHH
jgi:hypothetical protein